ncbi:MAG: YfhO family protein, partial [Lachnospiraceae bacterium]|nr:YfhO family protein [Lachnospiraceae bacterium]
DFSIGFGENIYEVIPWNGFGDPFNFISVFFPVQYSAIGFTIAQLLRIYFAGLFFVLWCKNRCISLLPAVTGALFYSFSMYTALFGLNFSTFMTALTALPLLALGVDRLLSSTKSMSYLLIIAVALQGSCTFYWIYMDSLFFLLYIPLACRYEHSLSLSTSFKRFGAISLNYVLGLSLSAVFFIPGTYVFLKSNRSSSVSFSPADYLKLYSSKEYLIKADTLFTPHRFHIDSLFLGIGFLLCLIIFMGLKKYRMWKILATISFIGYLLPGFGRMMNGFSYTAERWIYLLYFVFAYIIAVALENIGSLKKSHRLIFTFCFPVWLCLALCSNERPDLPFMIRIVAFCLVWIIFIVSIFVVPKRKPLQAKSIFCWLTMLSIVSCQMVFYYPKQIFGLNQFSGFRMNGVYDTLVSNNRAFIDQSLSDQPGNSFRTDLAGDCPKVSLITKTNSTSSYYTAHNNSVCEFLHAFGFSSSLVSDSLIMIGLDGRLPAEMLFSIKSYADPVVTPDVQTNPYYLPLGFCYDSYLSAKVLSETDLASANALLTKTVFLDESSTPLSCKTYDGSLSLAMPLSFDMISDEYESADSDRRTFHGGQTIRIVPKTAFSFDPNSEYYLVLENFHSSTNTQDITIGSKQLQRHLPDGSTDAQSEDLMVKIAGTDFFDAEHPLEIAFQNGTYTFTDAKLYSVDVKLYEEASQERSKYYLQDVEFGANSVSGKVDVISPQILFTSIPYDKFWRCTIDGEKATILKANCGFCATILAPGSHEITFYYSSPVNKVGLLFSLMTIFSLLAYHYYINIRKGKRNE